MTRLPPCAVCVRNGRDPDGERVLRVLAVDDEVPVLEELVYLLRSDPRIAAVQGVSDATDALRLLHQDRPPDAVFLDIRMPGLSGLDVARLLSRFADPPTVVFVTAHDEFAADAFDLKAVDYLRKPVRPERLSEAVHRVLHAVDERRGPRPEHPGRPDAGEAIPVELGGTTRFIRISDVRHADACGDYARLHTASGSFLLRVPLTTLAERWRDSGFVRVHRSHLVALRFVEDLTQHDGQLTVLVGGVRLAVSRRHARQVRDLLDRHAKNRGGHEASETDRHGPGRQPGDL
ncbi:LytTR family DNA-binding domain-containing protein [Actinocrispum sp. NPDC049592]|uniref:LytR/AlgR family response regulator transcription factor n=1 Tax=Actinocrispum sp. NPDC049592 TaxID=3154835 RepID=UPI00344A8F73